MQTIDYIGVKQTTGGKRINLRSHQHTSAMQRNKNKKISSACRGWFTRCWPVEEKTQTQPSINKESLLKLATGANPTTSGQINTHGMRVITKNHRWVIIDWDRDLRILKEKLDLAFDFKMMSWMILAYHMHVPPGLLFGLDPSRQIWEYHL